jgi:ubiquinol-cytochrome c reductase cytochrome b subunit
VTGILLALIYVPSASEAWSSLQVLNHEVTLGWFIRGLHGWGSNFMVAIVLIHMVQVFLFGTNLSLGSMSGAERISEQQGFVA